jgi:hypothetical protein
MEEFFIALLQAFFEILFGSFIYTPLDFLSSKSSNQETSEIIQRCVFWCFLGLVTAGGSLWLMDHSLIQSSHLRMLNIVFAPISSAYISKLIANGRATRKPNIVPRYHFWQAFWFTLGFVMIRFIFAKHN